MHQWTLKSSKEQPNGQGGYGDGFWTCPNCETKNAGDHCLVCGQKKPQGKRPPANLLWYLIAAAVCIFVMIILTSGIHTHQWVEANCEHPRTCSVCEKTEGAALEHKWSQATCEYPKTCLVCGATEGTSLEHKWSTATCTEAKACSVCKKTDVPALGHIWQDATYDTPKMCTRCGETDGQVKGYWGSVDGQFLYEEADWVTIGQYRYEPLQLERTIEGCRKFDLWINITALNSGSPNGGWKLYGRGLDNQWFTLGNLELNHDLEDIPFVEKIEFFFDTPTTFSAIILVPDVYFNGYYNYGVEEVQVYEETTMEIHEKPNQPFSACASHSWSESSDGGTMVCKQCGVTATRIENVPLLLKSGETSNFTYMDATHGLKGNCFFLESTMSIVKMGISVEFGEIVKGDPVGDWALVESPSFTILGKIPYQSTGTVKHEVNFEEPLESYSFFLFPPSGVKGYFSIIIDYAYVLE